MDLQDPILTNSSAQNDAIVPVNPEDFNAGTCGIFHNRKILKYILIVAAVCITLTGLFWAWLCIDFHPHKSLEEMGAVTFQLEGNSGMSGNKPGYPFLFLINVEGSVQWDININCGTFLEWRKGTGEAIGGLESMVLGNLGKNFVISNGTTIYWTPYKQLHYTNFEHKNHIYIEAIIYVESNIVGYCVIQVHRIGSSEVYEAEILDSAYYPPQNDEYQDITMEHIRKQILKAKILG